MKFGQMLKARNLTLKHQAMLKNVPVVAVVLNEDVTRVAGYNTAKKRTEVLRLQCGSVMLYGDDVADGQEGAFKLHRKERYWILLYQTGSNMQTFGPYYWTYYDDVARLVDFRGRSARGRDLAGTKVFTFSENTAVDQKIGEELLIGIGHPRT